MGFYVFHSHEKYWENPWAHCGEKDKQLKNTFFDMLLNPLSFMKNNPTETIGPIDFYTHAKT